MIKLNGHTIEFGTFPNGEVMLHTEHITKIVFSFEEQRLMWKWENDADIFKLIVLKQHLDHIGCCGVRLDVLYMPYSRMDRTKDIYAFTLSSLCNIINWLKFTSVTVYEPHSHVTMALLDRAREFCVTPTLVSNVLQSVSGPTMIMFPDQGAQQRYGEKYKDKHIIITGSKTRDFITGQITGMTVDGDIEVDNAIPGQFYNVIIVDDLCSRGGTFVMAVKAILAKFSQYIKRVNDVPQIYLVVAHCERTIHDGELLKSNLIAGIWTTDSIISDNGSNDLIHVINHIGKA
jgi:ribose-phosphate pyrophosphokinase